MKKTWMTAVALLLSVATRDAAADDTAAVDAQIKTTLGEIRRVATELAALRAALADSTAPAPGGGRTAGDSTAPTPGTSPSAGTDTSFAQLAVQVAVVEAQLVQLQVRLGALLLERSSMADDAGSLPGTAANNDGSLLGMLIAYQRITQREAAADQKLVQDAGLDAEGQKVEPAVQPAKPKPLARRTR